MMREQFCDRIVVNMFTDSGDLLLDEIHFSREVAKSSIFCNISGSTRFGVDISWSL